MAQLSLTQAEIDQIIAVTNNGTQNFYAGYEIVNQAIADRGEG